MAPTISINVARGPQIEAARDLTNRSWINTYSPLIGKQVTEEIIGDRHSQARFHRQAAQALVDESQSMFLVAELAGEVIGHCYAFEKSGCYVDRLHIDPDMKGRGIGRALLAHVENCRHPKSRVWLDVLRGNDDAMAFYRRVGFEPIGETDAADGLAGIPAVIFEKFTSHRSP